LLTIFPHVSDIILELGIGALMGTKSFMYLVAVATALSAPLAARAELVQPSTLMCQVLDYASGKVTEELISTDDADLTQKCRDGHVAFIVLPEIERLPGDPPQAIKDLEPKEADAP
jgi:hypothetical protein